MDVRGHIVQGHTVPGRVVPPRTKTWSWKSQTPYFQRHIDLGQIVPSPYVIILDWGIQFSESITVNARNIQY